MSDRPILFSAPMVRALLEGRKTQTRRVIPQRTQDAYDKYDEWCSNVSAGVPTSRQWEREFFLERSRIKRGDRLWVRETWQGLSFGDYLPTKHHVCDVRYKATDCLADLSAEVRGYPWRPSIFMPRWASRLTLLVTDVRVQRLQDISEADAVAEGIVNFPPGSRHWGVEMRPNDFGIVQPSPVEAYAALWNHINGDGAWRGNPWVCAYSFVPTIANIDSAQQ